LVNHVSKKEKGAKRKEHKGYSCNIEGTEK